ncbi:transposable element Tcb2 transposase [Trichonephila clavipes]|nr:transposable element Tcb2 transposase [Trichonephila clavipes]
MPGKRARRHFSQLSEFQRSLIIGMKAAGWSTRRVAGRWIVRSVSLEIVGSSGHKKVPMRRKLGLERPGRPQGKMIEGSHLAEANLKSKRLFRALPLTPVHRQLRLQWCQAKSMWNVTDGQKVVFSDESRFVLGTDDNRVRVWRRPRAIFQQDNARPPTARVAQDFLRHFQTLAWPARSPDLSPVEHVWDQRKRQMPSRHSVHDLELGVQDLWAHLPQDNIRCLINSMPDRVAACIADGDTRGLLATDHVILNHGQVTWTTPELAPPLLTTTPHQREDVSALDRFNVHRCPTRRVFSGTGLELVTKQATKHVLKRKKSGAQKRKRKLQREEANQKLAGSLNKFLRNTIGLDGQEIEPVPSTSTSGLKFYNGNLSQNVNPSESEEDTIELIENLDIGVENSLGNKVISHNEDFDFELTTSPDAISIKK